MTNHQMSKIAKASANKKHNVPDYKVIGKVTPDIVKKINGIVAKNLSLSLLIDCLIT